MRLVPPALLFAGIAAMAAGIIGLTVYLTTPRPATVQEDTSFKVVSTQTVGSVVVRALKHKSGACYVVATTGSGTAIVETWGGTCNG